MTSQTLKKYAPWAIALFCVSSALYSWYHPKEIQVTGKTEYVDRTKTVYVKVPIKVQDGVVQGTGKEAHGNPVIATADCPPSHAGSNVISTITPSTGEVHILVQPKPTPLFAFEDQKELGFRYNGVRAGLYGRWTFIRVGNLYGALYGEANTKPDAQVMAEVSYRW